MTHYGEFTPGSSQAPAELLPLSPHQLSTVGQSEKIERTKSRKLLSWNKNTLSEEKVV